MYRNHEQRQFARQLRRDMTDAETKLWSQIRCEQVAGLKFRRQAAIDRFVVDFVCFAEKLIVEVDGGRHNSPDGRQHDAVRTAFLESRGFRVLRFWNYEVLEDLDSVLQAIVNHCTSATPSPNPSPQGGGEFLERSLERGGG